MEEESILGKLQIITGGLCWIACPLLKPDSHCSSQTMSDGLGYLQGLIKDGTQFVSQMIDCFVNIITILNLTPGVVRNGFPDWMTH